MKKAKRLGKILSKIIIVIIGIIFLLILTHHVYLLVEEQKYNPPGELLTLANGKMHVYSKTNNNNSSTYVFLDAFGGGSSYYDYKVLWEPLSANNTIVTLDYLGYGMSSKTKVPRTIDNIVTEIYDGLSAAGIAPPYIFVSHSLGGFYATEFSLKYPELVESLIYIDNTPPELMQVDKSEFEMIKSMKPRVEFLRFTGLNRISQSGKLPWLTEEEQKAYNFYSRKMSLNNTIMDEIDRTESNANALIGKKVSDDIPMLMILSLQNEERSDTEAWGNTWIGFHEQYLNNNPNSNILILDNGHYIHWENPDAVLSAIKDFSIR